MFDKTLDRSEVSFIFSRLRNLFESTNLEVFLIPKKKIL